jgi:hypothetical protein
MSKWRRVFGLLPFRAQKNGSSGRFSKGVQRFLAVVSAIENSSKKTDKIVAFAPSK